MKGTVKPVRATILWGLLGAILYLPAGLLLHFRLTWPLGDWLFLWALLAGYSLMLSRWASKPVSSIALPLIILLVAALLLHSAATMGYVALGILAWIRSGICFTQRRPAMRFAAEIGLGMGASLAMPAGVLAAPVSVALGIWLFFLIQSLYLVMFEYRPGPDDRLDVDPFERARMAAEQILSD